MHAWLRRISPPAAIALLWPLLAIAPMMVESGAPAFQHDWVWPLYPAQVHNFMTIGFQAWRRDGIGSPPVYPVAWWPYLLAGVACDIAGIHGGLLLYVYAPLALAASGIRLLARTLGLSTTAQIIALAVYAGNPYVLNEIQAGHLIMLWAYALLPWVALYAWKEPTLVRIFASGVLIGLAAAQQQFLLFGLIVHACVMLWRRPARAYLLVPVAIVAAVVCMPEWIVAAFDTGTRALDVLLPLHSWQAAQSSTLSESVRLIGYIGGYDRRLPAIILALLWVIPIAAAAGTLRLLRAGNAFTTIAVAGIFITTGIRGPLASVWSYGFVHWHALALFRELYDGGALTALGAGVLCAIACDRITSLRLAMLPTALIAAPMLYITAVASMHLPWVTAANATVSFVDTLSSNGGNGRFMPLPLDAPLTYAGSRGGFSPLVIGVGAHPSAASTMQSSPLTYLARSIEAHNPSAPELARRLDVTAAVPIPNVMPAFVAVVEPRLKRLAARFAGEPRPSDFERFDAERLAVLPFAAAPGTLATRYTGARDLRAVTGGRRIDLDAVGTDPDPASSWARTALWPVLPQWAYAEPAGAFTMREKAQLNVPASWIVAGDASASIHSLQCRRVRQLDAHFFLLHCGAAPTLSGRAPLVVATAVAGGTIAERITQTGARGSATILASGPARLELHVSGIRGSVLVLRDRFDPGWTCSLGGARHVEVDGYANAWVFPRDVDGTVTLYYRPATAFYFALALSTALVALFTVSPVMLVAWRFRRSAIEAMT